MNDSISQQKQQVQELLGAAQSIGVVLSENQTMDSVAAALSIALILQDSGKNSQVVSLKDPIVEHSSLVGIDQIRKSFTGSSKTLTVSFPYTEGQIEKVSYNIEGDRLNVNLFAQTNGISFSEKDIRYIWQGSAPSLVITVGISDVSGLQGLVDPSVTKIINIDNNSQNAQFGDVVLVDPSYSSLSEMVAKITDILGMQVEFDVAQNLLDGIMSATHNFSSPKTSPLAFEVAGVLMQKGAIRRMQKIDNRQKDTSLQMLGEKQQSKQQFGGQQASQKQFNPQHVQGKQFGAQNFPKQNPFKKQSFQNMPFDADEANQPKTTPQQFEDQVQDSFQQPQFQSPAQGFTQPQNNMNMNQDDRLNEIKSQLQNMPTPQMPEETVEEPQIPTEDQAPSDWFTPKVFKSNKN